MPDPANADRPPSGGVDVVDKMLTDTRARLERASAFGGGVAAAIWSNDADAAARLERPSGHIFSLYLEGGRRTRRVDKRSDFGGPDKSCFLPSGHSSVWEVGAAMRFIHLYFEEDALAAQVADAVDADIRDVAGRELSYVEDPIAAAVLRRLAAADWDEPGERVGVTALAHEIAARNVADWFGLKRRPSAQGGLAPIRRRRVLDFIEGALDRPLDLDALAAVAGQSSWHFAKMFRVSVGLSPYAYVKARRMALALRLLRETTAPVGDVAAACGYASPTRFAGEVNRAFGASPRAIRASAA